MGENNVNEMKMYIGTKQILAKPMNRKDYNDYRGWELPADENGSDEGYLVEYIDGGQANDKRHNGYISWSPKTVFDNAYKLADTPANRIDIEIAELSDKITKAEVLVYGDDINTLPNHVKVDLLRQLYLMNKYNNILKYSQDKLIGSTLYEDVKYFDFGEAINMLKQGYAVARKGWNGKGLFIVKQIPAEIGLDIIPKMQSLPQVAKDILIKDEMTIKYTNQMLIINAQGRADSWVASSSDTFAEDWYVVE